MTPKTIEQLHELKKRLTSVLVLTVIGMLIAYIFKENLFEFLAQPLLAKTPHLIFTNVPELFFTYIKLSFFTGLFIAFPLLLWQIWGFVTPGLYQQEMKTLRPFILLTPLLFYLGGAFMHFLVMPLAVNFFFSFETISIQALPSVQNYFSFYIKMMFAFGLAFNLPLLILFLALTGVVTPQILRKNRRYVILIIAVAAAVLTPPDPLSQLLLAIPMMALYELAILMTVSLKK